jgi:hypothetical protein
MNVPYGTPLTAPHITTGGLCRWKAINKEGRHVGLDFYDLLIEAITQVENWPMRVNECDRDFAITIGSRRLMIAFDYNRDTYASDESRSRYTGRV